MEPFLKHRFPKLYRRFSKRLIRIILLALLGLILAFSIQIFTKQPAIGTQPQATSTQSICTSTQLAPEQLSAQGRISYDNGRFDVAIDCWQKAAAAYRRLGNKTESINNQINLAQAEQALGLYPRACNTLVSIYGNENCATLQEDAEKRNNFIKLLQQADSPAEITGLHSLGNLLREVGQLDLSHQALLLSLEKNQPQDQKAIWLDLGNTRRALSNKEQDLYNRAQERENLVCAIVDTYAAQDAYQQVVGDAEVTSNSRSLTQIQAQLNQLSLLLDFKDWSKKIKQDTNDDVIIRLFNNNVTVLQREVTNCWNQVKLANSPDLTSADVEKWTFQQSSPQKPLIASKEISNLQQQIEQLSPNNTALYTRLNFVHSLMRLEDTADTFTNIEKFFQTTIDQAKAQGNSRVESYALGYLGKLYENNKQWESAKQKTLSALLIAQSMPSPDMMYQWQWQLGRIYKFESEANKANTKQLQNDLQEARSAYQGAFQTLESLRRELAKTSPDTQLSFQNDIENIYREYVDLLLTDEQPTTNLLTKAREVITSLQAVELENFLRQACPEYDVKQLDQIINTQAKNTAFISPIVLNDRVEVIVKLPTNSTNPEQADQGLKHYRTQIERVEVEKQIRELQLDLEEEYTFDAVREKSLAVYKWLLQGAEKYLNQDIDTLVFALDTNLRNIPLAALVYRVESGKPKYLVEKYAIALSPRLQIPTPRLLQDQKLDILAAGITETQVTEYQGQFPKLRYVEDELNAIQKASPEKISVSQLIDQEFRIKTFKDRINTKPFQILHLATHGEFSSRPEKTFILTSDKAIAVNEVGNLFRNQAQNQREPIELLVLSACETAAGDQRATLGISGVGVQAGARSAIASLWTLDDQISVEFTKNLYQQLVNPNVSKAQALQQAQIALKDLPGREHPRYWASYILLGNWL